jgi:hypothetical protein
MGFEQLEDFSEITTARQFVGGWTPEDPFGSVTSGANRDLFDEDK